MKKLIIASIVLLASVTHAQKKSNTSTQNGRFQLIQLSDFRRDQYLVDTQTGKMWQKSCFISSSDSSECAYGPWMTVDVEDITMDFGAIDKKAKALKKMMDEDQKK